MSSLLHLLVTVCLADLSAVTPANLSTVVASDSCHVLRSDVEVFQRSSHCVVQANEWAVDQNIWLRETLKGFYLDAATGQRRRDLEKLHYVTEKNDWLHDKMDKGYSSIHDYVLSGVCVEHPQTDS